MLLLSCSPIFLPLFCTCTSICYVEVDIEIFFKDVTAVCILEGFQNPQSLVTADRVLKSLGQAKAKEEFKVRLSYFLELSHSMKRL